LSLKYNVLIINLLLYLRNKSLQFGTVNEDVLHPGIDSSTSQSGLVSGLHTRHLSSCSRVHRSSHPHHTASIPDSAAGTTRLHVPPCVGIPQPLGGCTELGVNSGGTGPLPLQPAGTSSARCSVLSSAAGFMSTCGPASSYYYRSSTPMTAALGSASLASSSYFQPNPNSVSGLPPVDDDDDNDIDEPIASSEEEENKPRIWSIADVATSCRPLQQRGGLVGLTSVGGTSGHNGFLHPWSNSSASFNYTHYQSVASQTACPAATSGFYTSYCQQQRPVATPLARQHQLQPAVPVGMTTAHQQTQLLTGDAARCSQLSQGHGPASQFSNIPSANTFEMASTCAIEIRLMFCMQLIIN